MSEKDLSNRELTKMIKKVVRNLIIEEAHHCAPVYSLADTLAIKSDRQLRSLAKTFHVKGYTKMEKPNLVSALCDKLLEPERLLYFFRLFSEETWDFFIKVASHRSLKTTFVAPEFYLFLQRFGLMQSYYHQDKIFFVVPREIRKAFSEIMQTDFPADKALALLLDKYAAAAASLYGVILLADLVKIFNNQTELQLTVPAALDVLSFSAKESSGYLVWHEYLVEAGFADDDFADVRDLAREAGCRPRYLPEQEVFLRYADFNYFEPTSQSLALKLKLLKLVNYSVDVNFIMSEFHELCMFEARPQEYFDVLNEFEVPIESESDIGDMLQLIVQMCNNTRMWQLNGHTPAELYEKKSAKVLPFPGSSTKSASLTGRNDPCPCGSGKKYKNCCGKAQF